MAAADLHITTHRSGDRLVVTLTGPLDIATRDTMTGAIAAALTDDLHAIEIDVGQLTFCDSSGLAALIGLHRAASVEGKCLYLHDVSTGLARVLAIAGLDHLARFPD